MAQAAATEAPGFVKMHGLGNDFVVLDARAHPLALDSRRAKAIADRKTGVGCDQLITLEAPNDRRADAFMRIHNADGGEVEACGNATRCIATLLMDETGRDRVTVETVVGLLEAERRPGGLIAVDMGPVRLDWQEIPLAHAADTSHVNFSLGPLSDGVAVNVGNPHIVFFVPDAEAADLEDLGPKVEHDALFPERTNVEAVTKLPDGRLRMRVWERGVGITRACGTGACAAAIAAHRRGLTGRRATVILDGGSLEIEWRDDNHVVLIGPVATSFTGRLSPALLG